MLCVSELELWRNRNYQGELLLLFAFHKVMFLVRQGLASFLSISPFSTPLIFFKKKF